MLELGFKNLYDSGYLRILHAFYCWLQPQFFLFLNFFFPYSNRINYLLSLLFNSRNLQFFQHMALKVIICQTLVLVRHAKVDAPLAIIGEEGEDIDSILGNSI